ncbi:hypothetical protein BDB00DRAFT_586083 [Zychaea mexicana]|uniref:uncharacterized protein n=1 Tax=Zychaea mexicana TaxID=64656 RepID=UPI0022FEACDA|nr:uncharacterized protein BDB00DRAFT_586083 [Zychaea mexicana]KAI9497673.1 hypothetical protein BDB00DRAFT_586083 [Zychaea mexicana]
MTQSPNLRFFGLNKERKNQSATAQSTARSPTTTTTTTDAVTDPAPQGSQTSVHGWLMNVPGYREERKEQEYSTIVDEDNNGIPTVKSRHLANGRPESISSVSSADSVNLDDLIKNNFTNQVDDETDLPNLADLDLDDSADDFWKMSDALTNFRPSTVNKDEKLSNDRTGHEVLSVDGPFDESEFVGMGKMTANEDDELMNWSPESSTGNYKHKREEGLLLVVFLEAK